MAHASTSDQNAKGSQMLFWGCFIALITTSFAFITRITLFTTERFGKDFGIDSVQVGELVGAGIWPFGISIILFSLVIDKIGYRVAMFFSFVCYVLYLILACMAYAAIDGAKGDGLAAAQASGLSYLYIGSIILALGNGTVEAFINPVVATMFNKEKTKWLNILHAGWPGGLVIAGLITIAMSSVVQTGDWRLVLGLIAIPAIIYLIMLVGATFPKTEREQAGVSYREMLGEFGAFGALVGFGLIFMQLGDSLAPYMSSAAASIPELADNAKDAVGDADIQAAKEKLNLAKGQASKDYWMFVGVASTIVTVIFGVYTKSLGRGILAFLILIMMPLATTEIGTDGWITKLMEGPMENYDWNAGWVLVYTSAIMMILRFFAGPIVHKLSPIGLLITSAALAIGGLLALSQTGSAGLLAIFGAATIYGFGKTFFWPTMLGVTSEQCPKGGALTLNAISGIGMIAVGVLGSPLIGFWQEQKSSQVLEADSEVLANKVLKETSYMGVPYKAVDPKKKEAITGEKVKKVNKDDKEEFTEAAKTAKEKIGSAERVGQLDALTKIAMFPAFMLACYIALFFYFKQKGGYSAEVLTGHAAEDEKFTGGVEGPADP